MRTQLTLQEVGPALDGAETLIFVGRRDRLLGDDVIERLPPAVAEQWTAMLDAASPGDHGASAGTFVAGDGPTRVIAGVLPEACSRHNSPARPHGISKLVRANASGPGRYAIVCALDEAAHAAAAAAAVGRALPIFGRKSGDAEAIRTVGVALLAGDEKPVDLDRLEIIVAGVRQAAQLVDTPTNALDTDAFVELARETAARLDVEIQVLQGESLGHAGLGGLWGVGKAASRPPALVILEYTPKVANEAKTVALVGKGIVYDTGGLSLKPKGTMSGMKGDMGGAAAVLSGFATAVRLGSEHKLVALLCLAENAIGPEALRNDDIITLYSGKTVEINNTDAEGRLVLGDGVAYAARHYSPDVIIDMATLTGAQLISTGHRHAAAMCNDDDLEAKAIAAGKLSGDLVHPIPYCPEFYRKEFKSVVADLKNSVKDRMNAQSSCAGQFIGEHLGDYPGLWLHLDIAGPSGDGEWGTGYGVNLLVDLLPRI